MERVTAKDPVVKLAYKRLSILELGSVSKACKQTGTDRTSFYEWKLPQLMVRIWGATANAS